MERGCFYFVKDTYFIEFKDPFLMKNKENINGKESNRPCFFYFKDSNEIFWLIPISSRVEKFKELYEYKVKRYKVCDTIHFAEILGKEKAFLLQNMFPITQEYIEKKYLNNESSVKIKFEIEKEIMIKAKKVLALQRSKSNLKLILPNVFEIEKKLIEKIEKAKTL